VATVNFSVGPFHFPHMDFIVGGNELGAGAQVLLGQNFLQAGDVEYDLANGAIRLMRPGAGCAHADLAYWAKDQAISALPIEATSPLAPSAQGIAYLNGKKIRVVFDTGAPLSMLSLRAAARAGVRPTDPGVMPDGYLAGVGRSSASTWIAPFDDFKLGGEEIRHTHLRIADLGDNGVDMYIGADFFLAHHVYVANSQHRIYFTYNGGPVFNLTAYQPRARGGPGAAGAPTPPAPTSPPPQPPLAEGSADQPVDAPGFARRGAALAARGEFKEAIADLTRACQLDPREPSYFEQRAAAELRVGEPMRARADFDQAIGLKPDDVTALFARARLRLAAKDRDGAASDLQVIDRTVLPEADERLALGNLYLQVDLYAAAVRQYSLWLDAHRDDIAVPTALNQRCWAWAQANQELKQALGDCNRAIRDSGTPATRAAALDSRGLVRLRLGDYARSLQDYDASLKIQPRRPWALYGRGIDELRQGRAAAGQADLQAAVAVQPQIAAAFRRIGISP
jgi:tetratricopeptide (TPR) repeat protein